MGQCSNCYDGCTQTTSDKCVKYTGMDVGVLGIKKGDSLSYVEQAIIGFLVTAINGTGIKFNVSEQDMCKIVSDNLQDCQDLSIVDYITALIKTACTLDENITSAQSSIDGINSSFDPGCLTSINGSEGAHIAVQAVINKLCGVDAALGALALNISTNYVRIEDINTYIATYLAENANNGNSGIQTKMVPFTIVEYYGPLNFFDATGAGTGEWTNIYLCNGENNTPDKRGRVAVGTTDGSMRGGAHAAAVNPSVSGNPTYTLLMTLGDNSIVLSEPQMPSHVHTGVTDPAGAHSHTVSGVITRQNSDGDALSRENNISGGANTVNTSENGSHAHDFITHAKGGNLAHSNIQPVLACHYIMYIPV